MIKSSPEREIALVYDLRQGKAEAFERVYRNYYRMVATLIQKNSGTDTDVEDVFQETLFILVKKLRNKDFELTSKLGTYIYSISRNLWMQRLSQQKKDPTIHFSDDGKEENIAFSDEELELNQAYEKKHVLIAKVLKTLKEDCKKIIIASFYQKWSHELIATEMGYSQKFVRVKLHRCMEKFREKVQQHADFQNL